MFEDDAAAWRDWNAAAFAPLAEVDSTLDGELRELFARAFIRAGGLSLRRERQAAQDVSFHRGVTPMGIQILRARLPLGAGAPEHEWDGSGDEAREIVRSIAVTAGETIEVERLEVGPTGWEVDFDQGE